MRFVLNESKIKEERLIHWSDLRNMCIDNGLFSRGSNEDFSELHKLCTKYPTDDVIYQMAKLIQVYSDDQTVENIMGLISNTVIKRIYTIR